MESKIAALKAEILNLSVELQQQKGMLWILGEIIKNAASIDSFRELMKILTDMLMGVMGLSACYLWIPNDNAKWTLHYRSIFLGSLYQEIEILALPDFLQDINGTESFNDGDIQTPFIASAQLPGSRLAVPLYDFQNNIRIGMLVVEHQTPNFFTSSTSLLFETLAIFIAANSRHSKLLELASRENEHDPLTKAYNRRYLTRFLQNFHHGSDPLSFCVFDIDFFKDVNDNFGHAKGDEVLMSIAQVTQGILSPYNGKLIRYGGDEFIVLLNLPIEESIYILDQIRVTVPNLPVIKKLQYPVTITMGASEYPSHSTNVNDLFHLSDEALLLGKSKGRDCLEVSPFDSTQFNTVCQLQ